MMRVTVGVRAHRILPSSSLGSGGMAWPVKRSLSCGHVIEVIEAPPIENLKAHQVQMNRMRVVGQIDELPDLRLC